MLSMLWSLQKQFLFVHVAKAAGSSIRKTLAPYCPDPRQYLVNRLLHSVGVHVNRVGPFPRQQFRIHDSARIVKSWLPADVYNGLFKFAFVRNPWDRMVSMYSYLRMRTDHHRHRHMLQHDGFEDYLKYEFGRRMTTQLDMIADRRGNLLVDYVGRFERFDADFGEVCRRLDIERLDGTPKNQSRHDPYQTYYNDHTRALVAEYFAREIEFFGYEFDAVTSGSRRAG